MSRVDAERIIQDLAGGQTPSVGDSIILTEDGWQFREIIDNGGEPFVEREIVISTDPVDPLWAPDRVGSLWLQVI